MLCLVIGMFVLSAFTQCDSTTAEEHKHQAIEYAEKGDHTKAAKAYLKAAEKGDAEAQFIVGVLYMSGNEVANNPFQKDYKKSLMWLEKSVEQGNTDAMFLAGFFHSHISQHKDIQKAIKYWQDAEYQNSPMAAYFLGNLYDTGENKPIDKSMAIVHYSMAYKMGNLLAGLQLARLYLVDPATFYKGMDIYKDVERKIKQIGLDPLDQSGLSQYEFMKFYQKYKI